MLWYKLEAINRAASVQNPSLPYLKNKLVELFNNYYHSPAEIIPDRKNGKFHRSRLTDQKPQFIMDLSYPPFPEMVKLQRANHEKKPVFYCSGDPRAALLELELRPGDTLVLSKWTLSETILVFLLGYTPKVLSTLGAKRKCPSLYPEMNKKHNERTRSNIHLTEFFDQAFTDPSKDTYFLSATIAEIFLESRRECGIAYPAIGMNGDAENFAFTTALVDSCLNISSAKWFKVMDSRQLVALDYADTFIGNKIVWRGGVPEDEKIVL